MLEATVQIRIVSSVAVDRPATRSVGCGHVLCCRCHYGNFLAAALFFGGGHHAARLGQEKKLSHLPGNSYRPAACGLQDHKIDHQVAEA